MAKRFTDSEKWKDAWFCDLPIHDKLFWVYILDDCNHAGIWKINMRLANFSIGYEYTLEGVIKALGRRVFLINDDYLLVERFVHFQHPNGLNPKSKPQKAAIDMLLKHKVLDRVSKGYDNPIDSLQDKDIDKDKDSSLKKEGKFKPPTESGFIAYAVEKLAEVNSDWDKVRATKAAKLKFETYVSDGWKDGYGKDIKNWKTKAMNSLKHEKPWNYGKATKTTEQPAHLSWSNKP